MYRVLDLFSGIGGFSLGLERTEGFKTVAFCEIDPFCRAVLRKNWPDVPVYEDIRTLKLYDLFIDQSWPIDVICGGFPCQPFSSASAGKQMGSRDDRFLWPEMHRIILELRPTWVIAENVVGIESLALEQVVSDLETSGYEVAPPLEIPACAVGHDHRRNRFWIIGHSNCDRKSIGAIHAKTSRLQAIERTDSTKSRAKNGIPGELDASRRRALGNAVIPQIPEIIGRAILDAS